MAKIIWARKNDCEEDIYHGGNETFSIARNTKNPKKYDIAVTLREWGCGDPPVIEENYYFCAGKRELLGLAGCGGLEELWEKLKSLDLREAERLSEQKERLEMLPFSCAMAAAGFP